MWNYYANKIQPFIETCHQRDRMNPLAWLDCGKAVLKQDVDYFVNQLYKLSFHHMLQEGEADLSKCAEAVSPFSPFNYEKLMTTRSS